MFGGGSVDYQSLASKLLNDLKIKRVGTRPIVFVAHSLGGIMVKQALRVAAQNKSPIFDKTRSIIFLSTPHAGATIATVGTHLGKIAPLLASGAGHLLAIPHIGWLLWPIGQILGRKSQVSALTAQLKAAEPSLLELNRWYRTLTHIELHAFYETRPTFFVQVVDPLSADPGAYGCEPLRAEGKDHITISKPDDENDDLFIAVANIIESVWKRDQAGKGEAVLRRWIREIMTGPAFGVYKDIKNFADVPVDFRPRVELRLREKFRARFDAAPLGAQTERALRDFGV